MAAEILTREDLAIFKTELFRKLRELVNAPAIQPRKWLKSYEVRDLLGISPGHPSKHAYQRYAVLHQNRRLNLLRLRRHSPTDGRHPENR